MHHWICVRCMAWWFGLRILWNYHTIVLVNIRHLYRYNKRNKTNLLVMRTLRIFSLNYFPISCSNVNYSHHIVHYVPSTYLTDNWKFVPSSSSAWRLGWGHWIIFLAYICIPYLLYSFISQCTCRLFPYLGHCK